MDERDPYDLNRFIIAQIPVYENVVAELTGGRKRSHWIWFIFPQIDGLGSSSVSKYYAIKTREEAVHYLAHPVLGKRLRECTEIMLMHSGISLSVIMGYPDDLKFRSSMTLFSEVSDDPEIFVKALDNFCGGVRDERTDKILESTKI